jgi:hypothetical protein
MFSACGRKTVVEGGSMPLLTIDFNGAAEQLGKCPDDV